MAVKFVRGDYRDDIRGSRDSFDWRGGRRSMPLKQRLFVIYGGIAVIFVILLVAEGLRNSRPSHQLPIIEAEGVVLAKSVDDSGGASPRYLVTVSMMVPVMPLAEGGGETASTRRVSKEVLTDEASWRRVEEGSVVQVRYTFDPRKNKASIRGLSVTDPVPGAEGVEILEPQ